MSSPDVLTPEEAADIRSRLISEGVTLVRFSSTTRV